LEIREILPNIAGNATVQMISFLARICHISTIGSLGPLPATPIKLTAIRRGNATIFDTPRNPDLPINV
jgi:hypothetical protein